ncbi:MAG: PfkB family carbohydrate kinase [Prevotella sp.]|jgi:fructokinase|nr:PfkB family carbohydrate kinase [Prevotella sp.]MCH4211664.1 PfkB family carbohydrate kinase [Prevotella sp.]MCH4240892.1 PfkB family carbohydrate kinase [Prevotella sp.]
MKKGVLKVSLLLVVLFMSLSSMAESPRKVVCIGETVLDILFRNEKPISANPGGSALNSAVSLGRSGVNVYFVGETGKDHTGDIIRSFLRENGVNGTCVRQYEGMNTMTSLAFLDEKNNAHYSFYMTRPRQREDFILPVINPDDIVIFGSFYSVNPDIRNQMRRFLDYAHDRGAIIYYDVNIRPPHSSMIGIIRPYVIENMKIADVVRGSRGDMRTVFQCSDADSAYVKYVEPSCRYFISTGGTNPVIVNTGTVREEYPVKKIKTVSTIGAGDNFNAGFAFGLIQLGITRLQLIKGLSPKQWSELIKYTQMFSQNSCMSLENYVSKAFGNKMKLHH